MVHTTLTGVASADTTRRKTAAKMDFMMNEYSKKQRFEDKVCCSSPGDSSGMKRPYLYLAAWIRMIASRHIPSPLAEYSYLNCWLLLCNTSIDEYKPRLGHM